MRRLSIMLWLLLVLAGCQQSTQATGSPAAPSPAAQTPEPTSTQPAAGPTAAAATAGAPAAATTSATVSATIAATAGATAGVTAGVTATTTASQGGRPTPTRRPAPAVVGDHDTAVEPLATGPRVRLEPVAAGLISPVYLTTAGGDAGRLFVVDQAGLIWIIANGQLLDEPFLDLRDRLVPLNTDYDERGLLGLAFHPDYATNGRFFVYYSAPLRSGAPAGWNHTTHVAEFKVSSDPNRGDPASEQLLLAVDEPQFNHNGGTLTFGPDGFLYISLGDGGAANDTGRGHVPGGNAQDTRSLLGSILRIDVDHPAGGQPYGIPGDNPFADGQAGAPEIFAWGFRNPYRHSWDRQTGALYSSDAGQDLFEEVSRVERGGNYGWPIKEGTHCFDQQNPSAPPANCPDTGPAGEALIDPVIEYLNAKQYGEGIGVVVVGGDVYRGRAVPELAGLYIFGDWSASFRAPEGRLLAATPGEGPGLWPVMALEVDGDPAGRIGRYVLGFGEDAAGEVYVLTTDNTGPVGTSGRVFRLVPGS